MKNIYKICISFIITAICIQQVAFALYEQTYYECPSMMFYTPTMTLKKHCTGIRTLVNDYISKKECTLSYNDEYGKANIEYQKGYCRISNRRFVEDMYNGAMCNVDYVLTPSPKVMGVGAWRGIKNPEGAKCIDMLYRQLKEVYPDMQKYEY